MTLEHAKTAIQPTSRVSTRTAIMMPILAAVLACGLVALRPVEARAQTGGDAGSGSLELVDPNVFRACGDPRNMPFSNDKVMPSFASNVNVMCYLDDIYVYLRARANNAIPGGRPPSHEDKPAAAAAAETSCTGIK